MNSSYSISVISLLAIFLISIVIYYIYFFVYRRAQKYVMENSVAIREITALSEKYSFYSINNLHIYRKSQNSLAAFRRINYTNELVNYVKSKQDFFLEQIRRATENEKNYALDCSEFYYIQNTQITAWNSNLKRNIEESVINKIKLSPICSIQITIENIYVSPKGRNRYYDSYTFDQTEIIGAFSKIKGQKIFEENKHKERSKMSDSLRYDILKRDGFKCTICGATAQEGAKLHVDHIVPVSKGGKTVNRNLRTLCSSCNLGKSNKYDPYGIN